MALHRLTIVTTLVEIGVMKPFQHVLLSDSLPPKKGPKPNLPRLWISALEFQS